MMLGAAASFQGVVGAPSHPRPDPSCSSPAAHTDTHSACWQLHLRPSSLPQRVPQTAQAHGHTIDTGLLQADSCYRKQ